jgi:hypothetical protein
VIQFEIHWIYPVDRISDPSSVYSGRFKRLNSPRAPSAADKRISKIRTGIRNIELRVLVMAQSVAAIEKATRVMKTARKEVFLASKELARLQNMAAALQGDELAIRVYSCEKDG